MRAATTAARGTSSFCIAVLDFFPERLPRKGTAEFSVVTGLAVPCPQRAEFEIRVSPCLPLRNMQASRAMATLAPHVGQFLAVEFPSIPGERPEANDMTCHTIRIGIGPLALEV